MITAVYSLGHVGVGSDTAIWLFIWTLCAAAYFGVGLLFRQNRCKQGIHAVLLGFFMVEAAFDGIWAAAYCFRHIWLDVALGATYGIGIWILMLLTAAILVARKNGKIA